jgi:hypothetical protein
MQAVAILDWTELYHGETIDAENKSIDDLYNDAV